MTASTVRRRAPALAAFLALPTLWAPAAGAGDILVSLLTDIVLGRVAPTTGELLAASDFCVSLSDPGRYSITARGDGAGGEFVVGSGAAAIPLSLYYSDRRGRRGARLEPGIPLAGQKGRKRKRRRDCNRPNASLEVRIAAPDLESAVSGRYRGVITLTVAPE